MSHQCISPLRYWSGLLTIVNIVHDGPGYMVVHNPSAVLQVDPDARRMTRHRHRQLVCSRRRGIWPRPSGLAQHQHLSGLPRFVWPPYSFWFFFFSGLRLIIGLSSPGSSPRPLSSGCLPSESIRLSPAYVARTRSTMCTRLTNSDRTISGPSIISPLLHKDSSPPVTYRGLAIITDLQELRTPRLLGPINNFYSRCWMSRLLRSTLASV